jgi:hypothetical protein
MFIASSVENLDLAYAAQEGLEHDVESTVWNQGVFTLSRTTMSSLIDILFVFAPSDITEIRNSKKQTIRDNVIFELGLFIGRLGQERCFLIVPSDVEDLHLPSDLTGITTASYDPTRQDGNTNAALGPACNKIRKAVQKQKLLEQPQASQSLPSPQTTEKPRTTDENDIKSIIQTWMGAKSAAELRSAIYFDSVDTKLNLAPGSTRKFIEEVAARYHLVVVRRGEETILFRQIPLSERRRNRSSGF